VKHQYTKIEGGFLPRVCVCVYVCVWCCACEIKSRRTSLWKQLQARPRRRGASWAVSTTFTSPPLRRPWATGELVHRMSYIKRECQVSSVCACARTHALYVTFCTYFSMSIYNPANVNAYTHKCRRTYVPPPLSPNPPIHIRSSDMLLLRPDVCALRGNRCRSISWGWWHRDDRDWIPVFHSLYDTNLRSQAINSSRYNPDGENLSQSQPRIPKIIHQVWLGGKPLPDQELSLLALLVQK
jgi:hypothetical protein